MPVFSFPIHIKSVGYEAQSLYYSDEGSPVNIVDENTIEFQTHISTDAPECTLLTEKE